MLEKAVSLKLPTFWTAEPQIWFTQAEAQFVFRKIFADGTSYCYVLSVIDQMTASQLKDFIGKTPEVDKYEAFRARLPTVHPVSFSSNFS